MTQLILTHHAKALHGISEEIWKERGVFSATKKTELKDLGFAESQCSVPTTVFPVHDVWGKTAFYHHRPDAPRIHPQTGKTVKYEFPRAVKMAIDCHPRIRD
ncbi:MAG: hypothetical protein KY445_14215 [Armatimonadetes bacterium]|nr:hypothetical protein [Armatimonadota bacterium]